jgi:hypothetical protein
MNRYFSVGTLTALLVFVDSIERTAVAEPIAGTFQSDSISIGAAFGANNVSVAFTTFSSVSSKNPQIPPNGEFWSANPLASDYKSYWIMFSGGTAVDLGALSFGSSSLRQDSNKDGMPDFLERKLRANAAAPIVAISDISGNKETGILTLSRAAGDTSGSATTRFDSGLVFVGVWQLPFFDVRGSYDLARKTFEIRTTSDSWTEGVLSGAFARVSDDEVEFRNIIYKLDSGQTLTSTPVRFKRSGKLYKAYVEFADGNVSTGYPDYRRWLLQLTDDTDSDSDGIPNISDGRLDAAISISAPLVNLSLIAGQNAVFRVDASGSGSLRYQWQFNGRQIPGATSSALTILEISAEDEGRYSVSITDSLNRIVNSGATLTVLKAPSQPARITKGDFDSDEQPDLIFQNAEGYLAAWMLDDSRMTSSSLFTPSAPSDPGYRVASSGDFNGDGSEDLLFQHENGDLAVWYLKGLSQSGGEWLNPLNPGDKLWRAVASVDLDRDGSIDVLFQHSDGTLAVWFMNGTRLRSASLVQPSQPGGDWRLVGTDDFNSDAKNDLLFQKGDGSLAVWYMDGIRMTSASLLTPSSPGIRDWRVASVADRNGDGHPDLLFQNEASGSLAIWHMEGVVLKDAKLLLPEKPGGTWSVVGP